MRLSQDTLIMLARSGDDQAVKVLQTVENETNPVIRETEYHFHNYHGLFYVPPMRTRHNTLMGIPVMKESHRIKRSAAQ